MEIDSKCYCGAVIRGPYGRRIECPECERQVFVGAVNEDEPQDCSPLAVDSGSAAVSPWMILAPLAVLVAVVSTVYLIGNAYRADPVPWPVSPAAIETSLLGFSAPLLPGEKVQRVSIESMGTVLEDSELQFGFYQVSGTMRVSDKERRFESRVGYYPIDNDIVPGWITIDDRLVYRQAPRND